MAKSKSKQHEGTSPDAPNDFSNQPVEGVSFQGDERLRDFIDFLHQNDINQYIDLPEIAVMGDTSSGKSSLLSAVSQIQLPSNDQLTTRCPLRLRMENSKTVSARLGIKWHASSTYKSEEVYPLKLMSSWDEIPQEIEKAQACIIKQARSTNPDASVAKDIVEVHVYGPQCIDLTLIDLPGIVRFTGANENPTLGNEIKHMIKEYLDNERCVILAVVPANVDFHNSEIMNDARNVDPSTRRTIPVITKPDLIDKGAEKSVLELLLGNKHQCELGFHMVKCRGQQALNDGMSMADGMREEEAFFSSHEPWGSEIERNFFGVPALRAKLSALQVRMMNESLPDIMREIEDKRSSAVEVLHRLGTLLTTDAERRQLYFNWMNFALRDLEDVLSGKFITPEKMGPVAEQQARYTEFRDRVMEQRLANITTLKTGSDVVVFLEDGSEGEGQVLKATEGGFLVKPINLDDGRFFAAEKYKGSDVGYDYDFDDYGLMINKFQADICVDFGDGGPNSIWRKLKAIESKNVRASPRWLKDLIVRNRNNDLPCFLSAALFNNIVANMVEGDWSPLCRKLIDETATSLECIVKKALIHSLPERFPALHTYMQEKIEQVLAEEHTKAKEDLQSFLVLESHPYTQNHYLFENISKQRTHLLKMRALHHIDGFGDKAEFSSEDMRKFVRELLEHSESMSCEDHVAVEMQTVMDAYGKVACKRIMDEVPMIAQKHIRTVVKQLESALQQVADEPLRKLMLERPDFTAKHMRAVNQLKDMDAARDALRKMAYL